MPLYDVSRADSESSDESDEWPPYVFMLGGAVIGLALVQQYYNTPQYPFIAGGVLVALFLVWKSEPSDLLKKQRR